MFLALLVAFGIMKLVELVQFGAVTRFIPLNVFLIAMAIVGVILIFLDSSDAGPSNKVVALASLALLILLVSVTSQLGLLAVVISFTGIVFMVSYRVIGSAEFQRR